MAQDSHFAPTALCPPLPDGRRVSGVASPSRDALPARAFEGLPYLVSSVGKAVIRLSTNQNDARRCRHRYPDGYPARDIDQI
jgi:hypothetical protein